MNKKEKFASRWFRVATEGATVDGRALSRDHLNQMAKNFNPETYGARVWLEHLRGLVPGSPFDALGDVRAVKAEEVEGKMRLFAQIDPTDKLLEFNAARQKIYTSIELDPRFADTGEAYLVGLAVTDSPASVGTEALKFSVLSRRPQDFEKHLFGVPEEVETVQTQEPEPSETKGLKEFAADLVNALKTHFGVAQTNGFTTEPMPAKKIVPELPTEELSAFALAAAKLQLDYDTAQSNFAQTRTELSAAIAAAEARLQALENQFKTIDQTPVSSVGTGRLSGTTAIRTDC
jgi:hypothetical protein